MRVFLVTPTSTVASYCSFNEKRKRDPTHTAAGVEFFSRPEFTHHFEGVDTDM